MSSWKFKQEYHKFNYISLGFGLWCSSKGNIRDEMFNEYLEHHKKPNFDNSNFMFE